jgi:hypothetical protein
MPPSMPTEHVKMAANSPVRKGEVSPRQCVPARSSSLLGPLVSKTPTAPTASRPASVPSQAFLAMMAKFSGSPAGSGDEATVVEHASTTRATALPPRKERRCDEQLHGKEDEEESLTLVEARRLIRYVVARWPLDPIPHSPRMHQPTAPCEGNWPRCSRNWRCSS